MQRAVMEIVRQLENEPQRDRRCDAYQRDRGCNFAGVRAEASGRRDLGVDEDKLKNGDHATLPNKDGSLQKRQALTHQLHEAAN